MIKNFLTKRKIKRIQDRYSSTYDAWSECKDPAARQLLKCDLQDLADAYDILATEKISPVPGLSLAFLSDRSSYTLSIYSFHSPKPKYKKLEEKVYYQDVRGFGIKLRKLYEARAKKEHKIFLNNLQNTLTSCGIFIDVEQALKVFYSTRIPEVCLENYLYKVYKLNLHKWKPHTPYITGSFKC